MHFLSHILLVACLIAILQNQYIGAFKVEQDNNHNRQKRGSTNSCSSTSAPSSGSCDECGVTKYTPNARIVGGTQAVAYSWPAQVYIVQNIKGDYYVAGRSLTISESFSCGGTLINRYTVLTAAHCVATSFDYTASNGNTYTLQVYTDGNPYYSTRESMFDVYVGAFDISFTSGFGSQPSQTVKMSVKKVITHPSYDSNTQLNDIALFQLKTAATLNDYVQIACLPDPTYGVYPTNYNVTAWASGWGTLSSGGSSPNTLYNVRLYIYDPSLCSNVYPSYQKVWNSQVCAGYYPGGKDTCQGDSGGGLYAFDSSINKYVVVGVTSYGDGCGKSGKPGIYTRVSYFYDWITANWATTSGADSIVKFFYQPILLTSIWILTVFL